MKITGSVNDELAKLCPSTPVDDGHGSLKQRLLQAFPDLLFHHVLSRGGWRRIGGVVDSEGRRVANNLRDWVEVEAEDDAEQLMVQYADSGYIATRFIGKSHYFVAQIGDAAYDFVQLEVEELQEVLDHVIFSTEALPDNLEEIIDPPDSEQLPPDAIGVPTYVFRRITFIADFVRSMSKRMAERGNKLNPVLRFMQDWDKSSAKEYGPFCHHWVLSLRDYIDAWGEPIMQAKPVSTYVDELPLMKLNGVHRGSRLAVLVHSFDRDIGYPMAWYFFMLSHSKVPHQLAEAIHKDLMGAYDYLPPRDLKVLKDWSINRYGI